MLVTTYQHDYVPPQTRRYDFFKSQSKGDKRKAQVEVCQCIEEPTIEIPKAVLDQCQSTAEWTGIAPMGRLIEPRIIPAKFSADQLEAMAKEEETDCLQVKPNRFLKILRTAYPDLYERLQQMPKDELNRRLERERLYTTYQIDYCNMNEYPEGVYESLKGADDGSEQKLNASKLLQRQGACDEFRTNVMQELDREATGATQMDPCEKAYKPFKISFADSSRFINAGNNSHWRTNIFSKRSNFSEYMDTISKNGCIIVKNALHNHSKCVSGKHCRHELTHLCTNMK